MPNWTHKFYRSPAYREKMSEAQRATRAKQTPEQKELRNAKAAVAYRRERAKNLFDLDTYTGRRDAKKWIAVAEERLKKALSA